MPKANNGAAPLRLKYVTGFAKLFENVEYRKAWETRQMIVIKRDYLAGNPAVKVS